MSETVEVLGCKVRLVSDEKSQIKPEDVIKLVNEKSLAIRKHNPALSDAHTAALVALQIAKDYLELEANYKSDINTLESSVASVLQLVEEVSPTVI